MDVSISKRVMPLFGLLCAGALMCASALFFARMSLWRSGEASGSARIYILPFEYMDAILIESDGHFGMVDSDGTMATGWRSIAGSWYYFDDSGVMKANCWMGDYYFLSNGAMATNTVIDGYRIGPDGKWTP